MFDNPSPQQNNNQNSGQGVSQPSTPITRESILDDSVQAASVSAPAYARPAVNNPDAAGSSVRARTPAFAETSAGKSAGEPEDIFAGTDRESMRQASKPPQFQPKDAAVQPQPSVASPPPAATPAAPAQTTGNERPVKTNSDRKYVVIGVIVIATLIIVLASMIALAYYKSRGANKIPEIPTPSSKQQSNLNAGGSAIIDNIIEPTTPPSSMVDKNASDGQEDEEAREAADMDNEKGQYILDEITDSDSDGLTDGEEKRLGTDPEASDSDKDGLFDREEVRVYKTNPLEADTDGDGYSDGEEVKNGYNPNGEGKLYELP